MSEIARGTPWGKTQGVPVMLPHSAPSSAYYGLRLGNNASQAELRNESVTSLLARLCDCYS